MNRALEEQLVKILDADSVSTQKIELMQYSHDMAPVPKILGLFWKTMPDAVVRPVSTQQLQQIVKFASADNIPLIPRGRATTMMGGAYPAMGGITIDLTALQGIVSMNTKTQTVEVKAGTTWLTVLKYLQKKGFTLYCYPTSAPSATVGGWLGNGGVGLSKGTLGIGSSEYGYAADTVADLSVIMPNGEYIKSITASEIKVKDFIGSEGILGIFDTVTLKIRSLPNRQEVFCYNFEDIYKLCSAVEESAPLKPYFLLIEDDNMLEFKKKAGLHVPPAQNLVTVVFEGDGVPLEMKIKVIQNIMTKHGGTELAREIAQEEWRERFYPMRHKKAGPNLLGGEFAAPIGQLAGVVRRVRNLAEAKNISIGIHGTLGVNEVLFMPQVLSDERKKFRYLTMMSLVKNLNDISIELGGVPYGSGLFNAFYAKQIHGSDYNKLVELKKKFDPQNIMNPGKATHCKTRFNISLPKFVYGTGMIILGLFVKHGR